MWRSTSSTRHRSRRRTSWHAGRVLHPGLLDLLAPGYEGDPDFAVQFSDGALSAVLSNLSGYISATSYGLTGLVSGATSAIWNTPFALVTALGYLATGQIDLALAELQTW